MLLCVSNPNQPSLFVAANSVVVLRFVSLLTAENWVARFGGDDGPSLFAAENSAMRVARLDGAGASNVTSEKSTWDIRWGEGIDEESADKVTRLGEDSESFPAAEDFAWWVACLGGDDGPSLFIAGTSAQFAHSPWEKIANHFLQLKILPG